MTPYREILRLNSMGLSRTRIGASFGCWHNTVACVVNRAKLKRVELSHFQDAKRAPCAINKALPKPHHSVNE
jgi:hypothetical protein